MCESVEKMGMGWLPDYPDYRDYTPEHEIVQPLLKKIGVPGLAAGSGTTKKLPASVDLREWCSPVENQGTLGSCTANAGAGLLEYFERKAFGKHIDASRLFLYKTTRNLAHIKGDTGAFLRSAMGALVLFGVPPEEYWPYKIEDFDKEPPAFCYAFAQNYQAVNYYRLDPPGVVKEKLLAAIKAGLAGGLAAIFGFTVYGSITQAAKSGRIPYPVPGEKIAGGHAIMAAGYDDKMKIKNNAKGAVETAGALLIRNSWGADWGESGYGWLPYEYVLKGLAIDWWSLLKAEWIDTGEFKT